MALLADATSADDTDHGLFGVVAQVTKTVGEREPLIEWQALDPEPKLAEMVAGFKRAFVHCHDNNAYRQCLRHNPSAPQKVRERPCYLTGCRRTSRARYGPTGFEEVPWGPEQGSSIKAVSGESTTDRAHAPSQPRQFAATIAVGVRDRPTTQKTRTHWKNVIIFDLPRRTWS